MEKNGFLDRQREKWMVVRDTIMGERKSVSHTTTNFSLSLIPSDFKELTRKLRVLHH
jgi:hypothetical protein